MEERKFYIGHTLKKAFRAKIFNLLKDYSNGILWGAEDRNRLASLVRKYNGINGEFVSKTIQEYEEKLLCSYSKAMFALSPTL